MDEVRIWSVARTQAEILATMRTMLIGNEPSLVSYWSLNEGDGQTIDDASINQNTGQLGSGPSADSNDPA